MIRMSFAALATLLSIGATAAQTLDTLEPRRPVLKSEATVTGPVVRVGDLVENAGIIAKVPIFRAPDLGFTGTVPAEAVVAAVRTHALIGLDTGGVTEVTVTRAARAIPAKEIEDIVARALSVQYNLGKPSDITIVFERDMQAMYVDPSAIGSPHVARINYETRNARFDATLDIPTGAGSRGTLRITGRAQATVEVVTVARMLERGAILKESDVVLERRPRAEVGRDAITERNQAVGLAARNALQPGRSVRSAELMKPNMVQRNETVTLIYEVPGIVLTVRGKAAEGGVEGDVVSVLNEQSKRTVQGTIVGPGQVVISTAASRLAAANFAAASSADNSTKP